MESPKSEVRSPKSEGRRHARQRLDCACLSTALAGAGAMVAQTCSLPYRRFEIGGAANDLNMGGPTSSWRNAIPRYSRLKICATKLFATRHSDLSRHSGFGFLNLRRAFRALPDAEEHLNG
jgi:hypothetical protein